MTLIDILGWIANMTLMLVYLDLGFLRWGGGGIDDVYRRMLERNEVL